MIQVVLACNLVDSRFTIGWLTCSDSTFFFHSEIIVAHGSLLIHDCSYTSSIQDVFHLHVTNPKEHVVNSPCEAASTAKVNSLQLGTIWWIDKRNTNGKRGSSNRAKRYFRQNTLHK